ncbi:MAG: hypothetical protein IKK20_00445, partial [Clostridia bacterium]|nr:hypothetical protein [Clostridia bacterium]
TSLMKRLLCKHEIFASKNLKECDIKDFFKNPIYLVYVVCASQKFIFAMHILHKKIPRWGIFLSFLLCGTAITGEV